MAPRSDQAALLDILQAANEFAGFIEGMNLDQFLHDRKTQAAVQHQILIIGEASKHLTPASRDSEPNIPWNTLTRMRDRIMHGYFTVDLRIVWDTASVNIPALRAAVIPLLEQ